MYVCGLGFYRMLRLKIFCYALLNEPKQGNNDNNGDRQLLA